MLENTFSLNISIWNKLRTRWNTLPHALLLHGPVGIGKGEFAIFLAAALLCERPGPNGFSCGKCDSCTWFSLGNHPDFRQLQPAALNPDSDANELPTKNNSREITIDQVRELDDFLKLGSHRLGRRIVVINPAEAMNRNTSNALLKSLEEPGSEVMFVLVTHRLEQLLPTIRSRCQHLPFRLPAKADALTWLRQSGFTQNAAQWLARSGGSPLAAASLAANKGLQDMIGTLDQHLDAGAALAPVSAAAELEKLVKAISSGESLYPLRVLIELIQRRCTDLSLVRSGLAPRYDLESHDNLIKLAAGTNLRALLHFARALNRHKTLVEHPLNHKLYLEEILMHYRATFAGGSNDGR